MIILTVYILGNAHDNISVTLQLHQSWLILIYILYIYKRKFPVVKFVCLPDF